MRNRGFWRELKRRHVYRVAAAYAIVGWLLIQAVTQVFPIFHLPDWIDQAIVLLILVGFPIALVLAWAFDATPHGIVRTDVLPAGDGAGTSMRRRSRLAGLAVGSIGVLIAIAAGVVWSHAERGKTGASRDTHMASAKPVAATAASGLATINGSASAPQGIPAAPIAARPIPAKSIAVLPFENLSTDKGNAYFADGMQDLILTKLADIGDLKVISRTSTMQYGSHPQNLKVIAQQLGVAAILEGSVQKAGNQVLINVQLIDAQTDSHIWAQAYPRTLNNIFGVEGEVAQKVADALKAKLTPPEVQAVAVVPTRNPQAYDDFLRAQHFYNEATAKGAWATDLPKALAAYEKAVAEDPAFALAWAGLSAARSYSYYFGVVRSIDNLRAAEDGAKRALALAPNSAAAHVAMSQVYRFKDRDLKAARDEAQRALQLRPNDADAFLKLSWMESHLGDYDAAHVASERAAALDPNDSFTALSLGDSYVFAGDYPGARQVLARALAIDPQNAEAYALLSRIDILTTGDIDAATKVLDTMAAGTPPNLSVADQRIALLLYRRDFSAARTLATTLSGQIGASALHTAMLRGNVEWLAGDKDKANTFYRAAVDLPRDPSTELTGDDLARLGLAYARLGRADAAAKANRDVMAIYRRSGEQTGATYALLYQAKSWLAVGGTAKAIDTLAQILARPGPGRFFYLSSALLRLDPTWDPIRHDPRFQALLKKYGDTTPATTSNSVKASISGAGHD